MYNKNLFIFLKKANLGKIYVYLCNNLGDLFLFIQTYFMSKNKKPKAKHTSAKPKNTDKKKKANTSTRTKNTSAKKQASTKKETSKKMVKKKTSTPQVSLKNKSPKKTQPSAATQPKNSQKTAKEQSAKKKSNTPSAEKNSEKTKKKRKRTSERLPLTTEQLSQLPKPKYLVKLRIDAKTIIFVKDEASLKKWKSKFPNAEEIL